MINNYSWELKGWNKIFNELNAKEGKFSVLGNHDYGDYSKWKSQQEKEKNLEEVKTFYKDIGFTLLLNEAELLKRNPNLLINKYLTRSGYAARHRRSPGRAAGTGVRRGRRPARNVASDSYAGHGITRGPSGSAPARDPGTTGSNSG